MSRIGKKPVEIPSGVTATINGQDITVKGPKGELSCTLHDLVTAEQTDGGITIEPISETKEARSMWGLSRSLVDNLVVGVSKGFEKKLMINGVGYRAALQGKNLQLALGFSHDVIYEVPDGIDVACPKPTEIVIGGINKQQVGQVAAEIRRYRPPEPYKGKGVRYSDEYVVRKEGKKK